MSWLQGFQQREDLPNYFVNWADSKAPEGALCECITWFEDDPNVVVLHFYDRETKQFVDTKAYRIKNKPQGTGLIYDE